MSAAEIVKGKISNRTWYLSSLPLFPLFSLSASVSASLSTLCPDGSRNEWQIKLPNGIYVITIYG
eukprot:1322783-Amorphochlora_amoeboformis.AAC.1